MTTTDTARTHRQRRVRAVTVPLQSFGLGAAAISSPCRLMGWSLQAVTGGNQTAQAVLDVVAAAAGTLNFGGASTLAEVVVSPAAAWPAGVNQVTIGNIAGGTINIDIPGGTEQPVTVGFSPPVGVAGTPFITVPAMVGGPAYSIQAVGAVTGSYGASNMAAAQLMDGGQILAVVAANEGLTDTRFADGDGIYVGTSIAMNVLAGQMQGVVYVLDDWHGGDN